jgi:hypothetical protein
MTNTITDSRFFTGGRAVFTVSNGRGTHYTFKISKPRKQNPKDNPPFFVKVLTGPQNTNDFTYLGIYIPQTQEVRLTAKSRYNNESTPVKVIRWALKKVAEKAVLPDGYTIQHEGKCCRCGRVLTTPESIQRGIGPECIKMVYGKI